MKSRNLLEKNIDFCFQGPQVNDLKTLKQLASETPTLKFIDKILQTKITCDASNSGLGAMLEQLHDTVWYPIAFTSRSLIAAD